MKIKGTKSVSLGKIFIKRAIVLILIFCLIATALSAFYIEGEKRYYDERTSDTVASFARKIETDYDELTYEEITTWLAMYANTLEGTTCAVNNDATVMLYNYTRQEMIAASDYSVITLAKGVGEWYEEQTGQEYPIKSANTIRIVVDKNIGKSLHEAIHTEKYGPLTSVLLSADGAYLCDGRFYISSYDVVVGDQVVASIDAELPEEARQSAYFEADDRFNIIVAGSGSEDYSYSTLLKVAASYTEENGFDTSFVDGDYIFKKSFFLQSEGDDSIALVALYKENYIDGWASWRGYADWFPSVTNAKVLAFFYVVAVMLALVVAFITAYVTSVREKAHMAAVQYQKDMTAGLAHDLKSPLMVISGYAENLKENVHTEKRERYASAIMDNVSYMNELVGDVLSLSKVEDGTYKPAKSELELVAILRECAKKYEPAIAEKKLLLSVNGECTLNADRRLMKRAMDNLLNNAIKYTPEGGKINIQADRGGIVLKNDSQEKQKNGLGLSLVENICKLHGFKLTTQNTKDTFTARIDV